jgi:drug/metabolite transporter (DMT)-like permease
MLKIKIKDLWVFAAASLIGTLGLNICYNISINTLTLSFAAVLLGLSPVFVVLMAAPLFKEKITVRKAICTAAAVAGCVMVSGLFDSGTVITWSLPGILIGVLSGFFYALYSIFSRIAMDRGYHPLTVTFYSFLMLTVVLIPFTDWNVIGEIMTTDPLKNNTIMITHSLCVTILPYVFYNLALKYMETGMVSVLASAEPVAAMVFGAIIYSEMPSAVSLCGLILVLAALAVLSLSPAEK